jgi:tripartite-type tricarboxylate transporter receptor subunit TctC
VASFYRGKTVRIVVGTAAGGGFDVTARLLAERLPAYLPGAPTVIVDNRPGAGGLLAANTVYATEPRDGTVVLSFVSSIIIRQVLGQPGVSFDAGRLQWLGATDEDASACLVRSDTGVRAIQDMAGGKEVVIGTGGQGNDSHDVPAVLAAELGARLKLVPGYQGAAEFQAATEKQEIDGYCISFKALLANVPQWLEGEQPFARIVAIMGETLPDHPSVRGLVPAERLAKAEESRQLMRLVNAGQRINKPYAVAPEVPPDRVQALRVALARAYADPELRARADRARIAVNPLTGQQVTDVVQGLLRTPQPLLERLRSIIGS